MILLVCFVFFFSFTFSRMRLREEGEEEKKRDGWGAYHERKKGANTKCDDDSSEKGLVFRTKEREEEIRIWHARARGEEGMGREF